MPDPLPRIVLADEHLLFVLGLERLLESDTEVVRTVGDGRALLAAAEADHPDVVVCDIPMPKLNGLEVTRRLVERNARTKVVILSMYSDADHPTPALVGVGTGDPRERRLLHHLPDVEPGLGIETGGGRGAWPVAGGDKPLPYTGRGAGPPQV